MLRPQELAQNSEDRNGAFALVRKQINALTGLATSLLQTTRASDGRPLRTNERIPLRGLVNDVIQANGLNTLPAMVQCWRASRARRLDLP